MLLAFRKAEDPNKLDIILSLCQVLVLWTLFSGWGIFGLTLIYNPDTYECAKENTAYFDLRRTAIVMIFMDFFILFFNIMIIPKVIRAGCFIAYQRFYIIMLARSERVPSRVIKAFMLKVEKRKFEPKNQSL